MMSRLPASAASTKPPTTLGVAVWLATGGWVGFLPVAPGTCGALLGLVLAWGLSYLLVGWQIGITVALCLAGIPLCTAAARRLGGKKDPGSIVWDEIASLPITFFFNPLTTWQVALAGFLLHRLCDISKPPPARQLEALPEGLGIMADDWIAAVYANLLLRLLIGWLPALLGNP